MSACLHFDPDHEFPSLGGDEFWPQKIVTLRHVKKTQHVDAKKIPTFVDEILNSMKSPGIFATEIIDD